MKIISWRCFDTSRLAAGLFISSIRPQRGQVMSKLSEKLASLTPKARQYIMLGGAGTVFLGLVAGSVMLWYNQPAALPTPTTQQ